MLNNIMFMYPNYKIDCGSDAYVKCRSINNNNNNSLEEFVLIVRRLYLISDVVL